jgi:hypothetical protein
MESVTNTLQLFRLKANSHIACCALGVPLPCHAAKGLEVSFPFDLHSVAMSDTHLPCSDNAVLLKAKARPLRDGLWASCPHSASSGYHADFHEDCYQNHTNPPHNDPYL